MSSFEPQLLLGRTLVDKYVVEELVDVGGSAYVYRALHLVWRRPVAIKVLRLHAEGHQTSGDAKRVMDTFLESGALLARISEHSSAIVQPRDVGTCSVDGFELPYLVLEWTKGLSVERVMQEEASEGIPPRSIEEIHTLLEPIVAALVFAHGLGVVHGGIRPGKLLFQGHHRGVQSALKLLDFGLAQLASPAGGLLGPANDTRALASVIVALAIGGESKGPSPVEAPGFAPPFDGALRLRALDIDLSIPVRAVLERTLSASKEEEVPSLEEFWIQFSKACSIEPFAAAKIPTLVSKQPERESFAGASAMAFAPTLRPSTPPPMGTDPHGPNDDGTQSAPEQGKAANRGISATTFAVVGFAFIFATAMVLRGSLENMIKALQGAASLNSKATIGDLRCPDDMVFVEGGAFIMGSDDADATAVEKPGHQAHVSAFCMDRFEVTLRKYRACTDIGQCLRASDKNEHVDIAPEDLSHYDELCTYRQPAESADYPVNCVDWKQAVAYCEWAGRRLPTEVEWEFAARGSSRRRYVWGDDLPDATRLNACGTECSAWAKARGLSLVSMYSASDRYEALAPVGAFQRGVSPFGIHDMAGNVWEWVDDRYARYDGSLGSEVQGNVGVEPRVIRGGGWNSDKHAMVRATFRYFANPAKRSHGIGFRCARAPLTPTRQP